MKKQSELKILKEEINRLKYKLKHLCEQELSEDKLFLERTRTRNRISFLEESLNTIRIDSNFRGRRNRQLYKSKNISILNEAKSKGCNDCLLKDNDVLEFHHRNPQEKLFTISQAFNRCVSLEKLKLEIKKCDVLCANCHRRRHKNSGFKNYNHSDD